MRKILYAKGLVTGKGEEEIAANEERDERFLNRVRSDLSWGLGYYRARNEEFERQERWYFRDHYDMPVPTSADENNNYPKDVNSNIEDEHLATINIPFSSVQKAHTLMTGETPIIEVLKDTNMGARVAKMLHGVMQINTRRWGSNPVHDAVFNQLLYGWGCVRTTWSRNEWEDADSGFKGDRPLYQFPVNVRSLHPREIYPIPGGVHEKWKAVIHYSTMKVYEVEDEWNVTLHMCDEDNTEGDENFDYTVPLDPEKEVEVIDYWCWEGSRIIHAVIAHNQFVMRPAEMKFYDSLPYTIFFCASTTSANPSNFGLGINYALVDSVSEIEWLVNRMLRIADLYADPTLVITRINDEPVQVDPFTKQIDLIEGEQAHYLTHNGSLPELDKLLGFFKSQVEDEGFSNIAGESGIDTIAQQQAAMLKIFKPVENAQAAWEDINRKVIGLIQRYSWDNSIEVAGKLSTDEEEEAFNFSLKGSDTKGCRETKVIIRARFPMEELRNMSAAVGFKNSELMPDDVIRRRFLGANDPKSWDRKIMSQRIKNSPEAVGALIQQQLMLLQQQSTVQAMVQEELAKAQNEVEMRGQPGTEGSAQVPPMNEPSPVDPAAMQAMTEADAALGIADNPAPMGNPSQGLEAQSGNISAIRRLMGGGGVV